MACERLVVEVRPKPSCDQRSTVTPAPDAGQVAHGVEGDLRVVGAGLHAEVAAAARRLELVAGQRAAGLSSGGPARPGRSDPRRPVEQRRAEAEGDRQARRPQAERLAGVHRRGEVRVAAGGRPARPAVIRTAASRPGAQQLAQVLAPVGVDVERGEEQPVLRRRGDARLVAPWKGHGAIGGARRLSSASRPSAIPAGAAAAPRPRAARGRPEQGASRSGAAIGSSHHLGRTCESGSARASTACDSFAPVGRRERPVGHVAVARACTAASAVSTSVKRASIVGGQRGSCAGERSAATASKAAWAPSTLAAKSTRSMCE